MRKVKGKLFIISTILLLFTYSFGQKQSSKSSHNKSTTDVKQTQIPKGWKLVDLDRVLFILPDSMKDKKVRGTDSEVWRFEDNEMKLSIESGIYTSDFQDLKNSYEVKEEKVTIDGKNVTIFIWDENKDISGAYMLNKDGSKIPHEVFEKPFSIGVYFQKGKRRYTGTNFVISTKSLEEQEIAKKILQSIKFKQK